MGLANNLHMLDMAGVSDRILDVEVVGADDDFDLGPTSVSSFTRDLRAKSATPLDVRDPGGKATIPVGDGLPGSKPDGSGFLGGFKDRVDSGKLTGNDVLGMSLLSTGLGMASAITDIHQGEDQLMAQMQTEFDMKFGAMEFDNRMNKARINSRLINDMVATVRNIRKQGSDIASQDLGRQTQTFLRNPVTGAAV